MEGLTRHSLLTPAQEVELGREILEGLAAQEALSHAEGHAPINGDRSARGNVRSLQRAVRSGLLAQETLVRHNLRLVADHATRKARTTRHMTFDDHFQNGVVGLMTAVQKFDPDRGFRFSTYATWWIRQAVDRGVANEERSVRLPVHVYEQVARIRSSRSRRFTSDPSVIGREVGLPEATVKALLPHLERIGSLDAPVVDGTTIGDLLPSGKSSNAFERVEERLAQGVVVDLLQQLDERGRDIVVRRLGLDGGEPETLEMIAQSYNLTRERIRQIEAKAFIQLRAMAEDAGLRPEPVAAGSGEAAKEDVGAPGPEPRPTDARRVRVLDLVVARGGRAPVSEVLECLGVASVRFIEHICDLDEDRMAGMRLELHGGHVVATAVTP